MTTLRLLEGHALEQLLKLDAASVNCVVTSPPYHGLRDYGTPPVDWPAVEYSPLAGVDHAVQIPAMRCSLGLEPTLDAFIGHIVLVFREVRRVLRKDGTLWVNMGDSYAGARDPKRKQSAVITGEGAHASNGAAMAMTSSRRRDNEPVPRSDRRIRGLKEKDLIGQGWRVALALQADGWWLRSDIVWHKRNPMPESCKDRPTKAHEYLFLLTKSSSYWYDADAIKEPVSPDTHPRYGRASSDQKKHGGDNPMPGKPQHGLFAPRPNTNGAEQRVPSGWATNVTGRRHDELAGRYSDDRRPKAWDVDMGSNRTLIDGYARTTPKAAATGKNGAGGTGVGFGHGYDAVPKPRVKNNANFDAATKGAGPDMRNARTVWTLATEPYSEAHFATFPTEIPRRCILAGCPPGGVVLDPFNGSGTTGQVELELGRSYVGVELKADYVALSHKRLDGLTPGLAL